MNNSAATLYCSNLNCQAPNPQSHNFCQKCRTPLLKRYLWAVGEGTEAYNAGDLIAERYLLKSDRIILDTKPAFSPEIQVEIPNSLMPYLKLSPYQLHVPQLYGLLTPTEGQRKIETWLLEQVPIYSCGNGEGTLMPELTSVWKNASAMRQLTWLWQMANLWEPLQINHVGSSLLTPALLRVEGSILRLLILQADQSSPVTLQNLGQLWSKWVASSHPTIGKFLEQVCQQLNQGAVQTAEQLVTLLDEAMTTVGRSQSCTYQIVTRSETGPTRRQNEDACYPPSPSSTAPSSPLAIVCDGIGGHEGGEVASYLAIATIQERVQRLLANSGNPLNPTDLTLELETFACAANDVISQRNDTEQRLDRQRMGTTLVMALGQAHEMYITHVGDSRAYWITRTGCRQITVDDDIASREVRLGYALYRDAVEQSGAGSLVQALGMSSSATLHPSVQRFVLDEDGVFLLCSDGLSDNDRVEQYWETEILPILEGQTDLTTVGTRLMEIGNTKNGHDNITLALVYCQMASPQTGQQVTGLQMGAIPPIAPVPAPTAPVRSQSPSASRIKTKIISQERPARSPLPLLLTLLLLTGVSGAIAYWFLPEVQNWIDPLIGLTPRSRPSPELPAASSSSSAEPEPVVTPSISVPSLEAGLLLQITRSTTKNAQGNNVPVLLRRGILAPQNQSVVGLVAEGSILQVSSIQRNQDLDSWLQVKVCSTLGTSNPQFPPGTVDSSTPTPKASPEVTYRAVKQGEIGWIRESDILPVTNTNFTPTSANLGECAIGAASPTPTVTPSPSK
ncbi:protein phosphatase 2C domain-containing protein [Coleofasciculus sp. FACHB-1120]|uniref:protein phosphatase 2C domain-containing protein n=1 Tax=Coleofasciculus sp. FACHB-1120 TaxID=2692783 RepID=UPI001689F35F|nr:protein phosphatase 2C domain-containing protein [Coleofasciculus sp. FACHB-1120]MBD2743645.1 protein phosphatase 2C domain-containing protein [Coleofasciculus sp. FACHB-1120]